MRANLRESLLLCLFVCHGDHFTLTPFSKMFLNIFHVPKTRATLKISVHSANNDYVIYDNDFLHIVRTLQACRQMESPCICVINAWYLWKFLCQFVRYFVLSFGWTIFCIRFPPKMMKVKSCFSCLPKI